MAITITNARIVDTGTPTSPQTLAFSSATTANRGIIVFITTDSGVTVNTPTDTLGNTYLLVNSSSGGAGNFQAKTYYVAKGIGGANTVSVSYTGSATFFSLGISEITDSGGNPNGFTLDKSAAASNTTANPSVTTAATTVANEVVHAGMVTSGPTPTAGSGFTLFNSGVNTGRTEEWKSIAATGAQTIGFTSPANTWSEVGSTFFTAAGAAAPAAGTLSLMGVG